MQGGSCLTLRGTPQQTHPVRGTILVGGPPLELRVTAKKLSLTDDMRSGLGPYFPSFSSLWKH